MKTTGIEESMNLRVVRFELDFTQLPGTPRPKRNSKEIKLPEVKVRRPSYIPPPPPIKGIKYHKRDVRELVEDLLDELYADQRDWSSVSGCDFSRGSISGASSSHCDEETSTIEPNCLESLDIDDLQRLCLEWEERLQVTGDRLARCVRARDRLRRQQKRLCSAFTVILRHITGDSGARFGLAPGDGPGEGGYAEWLHAMRLVARLPAGVPQHFRKKLWLTLAERHLTARGVEWGSAERACFRGTAQPDDAELGAQILKDLHRTGCSLFCGTEGRENQAMLRRVLLAYARWNKEVGYCQGFNMIAAIILEVMEKSESDSLKVMIYLVEAVLPEGYFADDLRGLSADMAAFRDLLRLRLPRLAQQMDHLQRISDGGGVEPPLPDVFTMQWFLTLYATWLPRESLLRIWDLILLDGNEILLLTALAIWDMLQDRILSARSADEFYCCMGGGAGAIWEAGEVLVAKVVSFGTLPELPKLRSLHRYRVTPPIPPSAPPPLHSAMQSMTKRGLRLFYSEDEGDSSDDGNKMALATVIPRREDRSGAGDRLSLDIGALKRQYARLRERQRQAHVILAAACARHAAVGVPTSPTSLTVNNLLLGKSAIVSSRGRRLGPPPGAVPPSRQPSSSHVKTESHSRGRSSDTLSWNEEKSRKSLSRRNSVKWKDIKKDKVEPGRKASIDLDEAGDGVIVSELEANAMIASLRPRSSSESSSYSSQSASSTDTSLCDDKGHASDSEEDLPPDEKAKKRTSSKVNTNVPSCTETKTLRSPNPNESVVTSVDCSSDSVPAEVATKAITDYLDSAAGEPLRTYIDGFETKLKDNLISSPVNPNPKSPFKLSSPYKLSSPFKIISPYVSGKSSDSILQNINSSEYADISREKSSDSRRPDNFPNLKEFPELSPITVSPCHYGASHKSVYDYDFQSKSPTTSKPDIISRPPDIIDSLTMYPNFVPDIDLSEKNISDIDSPPRSPGAESVIVSEDEHPIPLKIDKYFEHSPEFFGARVTDPNNADIPNRRPARRNLRIPKKPDSLTLHCSYNEKLLKHETERASSLPQSNSFSDIGLLSSDNTNIIDTTKDKIVSEFFRSPKEIKPDDVTFTIKELNSPENIIKLTDLRSPKDFSLQSSDNMNKLSPNTLSPLQTYIKKVPAEASHIDYDAAVKTIEKNEPLQKIQFPRSYDILSPIESKIIAEIKPSTNYMLPSPESNKKNYIFQSPNEELKDSINILSQNNEKLLTFDKDTNTVDVISVKYNAEGNKSIDDSISSKDFALKTLEKTKVSEIISPKDYILQSGRKNSERALQIIQENSKILSRILTKQVIPDANKDEQPDIISDEKSSDKNISFYRRTGTRKHVEAKLIDSPVLRESTSDSLIGCRKKTFDENSEKIDFAKVRPISLDDPFSLEVCKSAATSEFMAKIVKTPSTECLANKTDLYGWENKGFLAKCDYKSPSQKPESDYDFDYRRKTCDFSGHVDVLNKELKPFSTPEWARSSFSGESKASVTLPSSEMKDTSTYDRNFTSDDYNYPHSSKYNDYVISKASDICSKTVDQGPKVCENFSKTENSQVSDFDHVVTSSISFTYEPSAEDDSPIGAKSNSSDTLCQITSLDQVSTPISPKIFPKDTPTLPKEYVEKSDRTKLESDDTCSAITSLIETETLSSLSYPRSPSTSSYHPFPTRPMRMPKELGVRLGMYPKDAISSPQK